MLMRHQFTKMRLKEYDPWYVKGTVVTNNKATPLYLEIQGQKTASWFWSPVTGFAWKCAGGWSAATHINRGHWHTVITNEFV